MLLIEIFKNNTDRLEKAKSSGFDTNRIWYHGSNNLIDIFDKSKLGTNTHAKSAKKGFFFTSNPDIAASYGKGEYYMSDKSKIHFDECRKKVDELTKQMKLYTCDEYFDKKYELEYSFKYIVPKSKRISAEQYQKEMNDLDEKYSDVLKINGDKYHELYNKITELENRMEYLKKADYVNKVIVHPVYLKMKNPLIFDFKGNIYREHTYDELLIKAKRGRRDGCIFQNTYDPGFKGANSMSANYGLCDIAVVFEPYQIQSIFSSFE